MNNDKTEQTKFSRAIVLAFTAIALASSGAAFFSIWDAILGRQLPALLSLGTVLLVLRVSGILVADYIGAACFRNYDEMVTAEQRKRAANLLSVYIGVSAINLVVSLLLEAIHHNPALAFPDGTWEVVQIWTFAGMPLQGIVLLILGVGLREADPSYQRVRAERQREDIAKQATFDQAHQKRMAELSRQSAEVQAASDYYASDSYRAVVMRATQLKLLRQLEADPFIGQDDLDFLQDAIPQLRGRNRRTPDADFLAPSLNGAHPT